MHAPKFRPSGPIGPIWHLGPYDDDHHHHDHDDHDDHHGDDDHDDHDDHEDHEVYMYKLPINRTAAVTGSMVHILSYISTTLDLKACFLDLQTSRLRWSKLVCASGGHFRGRKLVFGRQQPIFGRRKLRFGRQRTSHLQFFTFLFSFFYFS